MTTDRIKMVAIIVNQSELDYMNDEFVTNYYRYLKDTYERYPHGFSRNVVDDPEYPRMWYIRLVRRILEIIEDSPKERQFKIIKTLYKINIIHKNLFAVDPFCNRYKETTIMKARSFLERDDIPADVATILRYFLRIV